MPPAILPTTFFQSIEMEPRSTSHPFCAVATDSVDSFVPCSSPPLISPNSVAFQHHEIDIDAVFDDEGSQGEVVGEPQPSLVGDYEAVEILNSFTDKAQQLRRSSRSNRGKSNRWEGTVPVKPVSAKGQRKDSKGGKSKGRLRPTLEEVRTQVHDIYLPMCERHTWV